ncbi:hypothetical protein C427_3446 [Paraglaciecola psychrophila 170]|uniref:Uncharacterized protein n=1 Tax=Paraglaciecola psychrophila 170 TaxID=1129794 RepID=K6YVX0_9ALTE|nr:hypothetical protein C427_3446 [Paraglaciecola psychrophila 170]GAC36849.1 hypothetical protein GPSY_1212 [Paraglaciecola psychrophila 170]
MVFNLFLRAGGNSSLAVLVNNAPWSGFSMSYFLNLRPKN